MFVKISKVLAVSLDISSDELTRSFVRATRVDLPELCELMRMGFGDVANLQAPVLAWRYFDSSKYESDIFIFRYRGKIIGAVGAEPVVVTVQGAELEGIRCGDIVVHPEHMKRGVGAWMNFYLQHHFNVVMAMGSNESSTSMVRRIYKPMNCRHHLKILFSTHRYFECRGYSSWLVTLLGFLTTMPLAMSRLTAAKKLPVGYRLVISDNTNNLSDFFSSKDYRSRPESMVKRSFEFCRWRYDLNPRSQFHIMELHKQNIIVGYAVVKKNSQHSANDWQLMDWDFLPELRNEKHFRFLFSAVVNWVAERNAESLSVMASDSLSLSSLVHAGFSHRALEDGFYLWAKPEVDAQIFDQNNWFLSLCDTDEAL